MDLITKAYGLLWLYEGDKSEAHQARRLLAMLLNSADQAAGIEAAQNDLIEVPAGASVEKYPTGYGRRRDFLPNHQQ